MLDESNPDQRLFEAMEACRPESDDLADPALAFLAAELAIDPALREQFERMQRLDRAVGEAFADVPVPEGLDRRILARLAVARQDHVESDAVESHASEDGAQPGPRRRRRWWPAAAGAGAAAAVAAVVLVAVVAGWFRASPPSVAQLLDAAIADAADTFRGQLPAGEPIDRVAPPERFPLSRQVVALPGTRWRSAVLGEDRGVAFDLALRGRARATLYVLDSRVANLPSVPPSRPQCNTGGYCALAWQENGLVYVLVVAGDQPAAWRVYLDVAVGPVA